MLLENTNKGYNINDMVMVRATKQVGKIVDYVDGKWKVQINGEALLKESSEIMPRQVLLG